jgi:transmembrane sensor
MINKENIRKFFSGEATKAEVKLVLDWIYSDAFEKELSEIFHQHLNEPTKNNGWDEYHQLIRLKNRLKANSKSTDYDQILANSRNAKSKSFTVSTYWKVAATLLVLITFSLAIWKLTSHDQSEILSTTETTEVEKSTTSGQKSTIFLEDGSRVVLNSGSKIIFPEKFTDQIRMVELEGEAFFQVKSDSLKPFMVKTGEVTTIAVGTAFNINAYEENTHIISLVSGTVIVQENSGDQIYLNPGEQITYWQQKVVKTTFEPDEVTAWKDGILYFSNSSFPEIINRLERWYGVEIMIKNLPARAKHYTGKFNNESLENVLKGIGFINDFSFEISGKQVKIIFNK